MRDFWGVAFLLCLNYLEKSSLVTYLNLEKLYILRVYVIWSVKILIIWPSYLGFLLSYLRPWTWILLFVILFYFKYYIHVIDKRYSQEDNCIFINITGEINYNNLSWLCSNLGSWVINHKLLIVNWALSNPIEFHVCRENVRRNPQQCNLCKVNRENQYQKSKKIVKEREITHKSL